MMREDRQINVQNKRQIHRSLYIMTTGVEPSRSESFVIVSSHQQSLWGGMVLTGWRSSDNHYLTYPYQMITVTLGTASVSGWLREVRPRPGHALDNPPHGGWVCPLTAPPPPVVAANNGRVLKAPG